MTSGRTFEQEQRGAASAMAAAIASTVGILGLSAMADRGTAATAFVTRVQFVMRLDLLVVLWLAAAIANVARLRFFSAEDIGGSSTGQGSAEARQAGAILQNTLEQVVLAVAAHLIVAATIDRARLSIVAMVGLFVLGRLLFWIGYQRGARGRAFGFALTFYPSVLALLGCVVATASSLLT